MKVTADHRSRDVSPAPEAERAVREAHREIARAEVKAARGLAEIERTRAHVLSGFASVQALAAGVGYGPQQTNRLLALGRALLAAPSLQAKVRSGSVSSESAVSVGRVLREPALKLAPKERRAWVKKAENTPPRLLRNEAERAVEEARQGEPTLPMRFCVTTEAKHGFRRARLLMSKGEPRTMTEGATFGRLVKTWLARHDPRLQPLPKRRCGPTEGTRRRHVPRRVRAIVERRSGGTCEVCRERRATQKIHLRTPHARGGSREADNIADACSHCHVLVDAGLFEFSGFDQSGRPQWSHDPGDGFPTRVRERAPPCFAASVPFG